MEKAFEISFRKILDSSPDPLFVTNGTHILYTNKSGAAVLRSTPNETIGKLMTELIPSPAINSITAIMARHFKGEKIAEKFDIQIPIGDKQFIHMEAHIRFIDFEGKPAILTSMRDISSLKQHQKRLELLHRHAIKLENAVTEQEIVTISGKAMSDTLNYETISIDTIEDEYLIDAFSLFPDRDFKLHVDGPGITARAARTQETQFILDTLEDEDYVTGNNEIRFRSEIAVPVVSQGKTVAVINVERKEPNAFSLQDKDLLETLGSHMASSYDRINHINNLELQIERARALEETLRKSEEYYRTVFENTGTAICLIDADMTISRVNTQFEVLSGYSRGEVEGLMKWTDFVVPEFLEKMKEYHRDRRAGGQMPWEYVSDLVNKSGQVKHAMIQIKLIPGSNQSVASFLDLTELIQLEERLSGFMQSATDGFGMFDEDMLYIDVNDSWLQFVGLEREDVIGKHILDVFPMLKETGRYDAYLKVLETGESVEYYAVEIVSVSGRDLILDVSAFKAGTVLGVVTRDVSDRVRYQRRLEALHGHAASLSSAETMDEVADITRDSLNEVLGFNVGSLSLVEGDHLIQRYIWGVDTTEPFALALDGPGVTVMVVNSGVTQNIGDVRENLLFVERLANMKTVSELAVPVTVSGKVVGVINIESEIKDAFSEDDQRLVETLASHIASAFSKIEYSERLTALHSMALELSRTESVEGVVETTFRIMREALGLQFSSFQLLEEEGLVTIDIDSRPSLDLVFPLTGKGITTRAAREARTVLVGDVRVDPDYVLGTADSRSELAVPILVEDSVLGVLNVENPQLDAFTEDDARLMEVLAQNVGSALSRLRAAKDKMELERQILVQQVQVEQEQELGRLKNQFISTATHELRTPVTSILGFLEIVLDDPSRDIPVNVREDLNVVFRNAMRLVTLTNDLLDAQRITSGRFEIQREPVDLVKTLNEIVEELTPLFDEKQQELLVEAPSELSVDVDELRISQLFINLLRNANKFTPEGGNIKVSMEQDESYVQISVKDSGIGLSEEDIGKLFKPFPGIRHGLDVPSTGLGLSIAKGIVELHGGDIWAESGGPGEGSKFIVKLPV